MPQNEHIELFQKRYGKQLDYDERKRKRAAREVHKRSAVAKKTIGLKGKILAKERHKEKVLMKKTIKMHEEKDRDQKVDDGAPQNAVPAYLMERDQVRRLAFPAARYRRCQCAPRPGQSPHRAGDTIKPDLTLNHAGPVEDTT
jgi:hypothetical protein